MKTQHRNTLNLRHVENLEEKLATYHISNTRHPAASSAAPWDGALREIKRPRFTYRLAETFDCHRWWEGLANDSTQRSVCRREVALLHGLQYEVTELGWWIVCLWHGRPRQC